MNLLGARSCDVEERTKCEPLVENALAVRVENVEGVSASLDSRLCGQTLLNDLQYFDCYFVRPSLQILHGIWVVVDSSLLGIKSPFRTSATSLQHQSESRLSAQRQRLNSCRDSVCEHVDHEDMVEL